MSEFDEQGQITEPVLRQAELDVSNERDVLTNLNFPTAEAIMRKSEEAMQARVDAYLKDKMVSIEESLVKNHNVTLTEMDLEDQDIEAIQLALIRRGFTVTIDNNGMHISVKKSAPKPSSSNLRDFNAGG